MAQEVLMRNMFACS